MLSADHDTQRLFLAIERLVRTLRAAAPDHTLSPAAASALRRLLDDGPTGISELARREAVSQPSMSQLVGRMVSEGFLRRRTDTSDRRAVDVEITDSGRTELDRRRRSREAQIDRGTGQLDKEEREALFAAVPALEKLTQIIQSGVQN